MNKSYNFVFSLSFYKFLFLVLVVVALIVVFNKNKSVENIDNTSKLWTIYDINASQIKSNLATIFDYSIDDVTCKNLNDISIKEVSYENALNSLGCYITLYYYNLTEYNDNYHNYIIKYRDKNSIKEKEFLSLKQDLKEDTTFYNYLKNMSNYKVDDEKLKKLNNIVSSYLDNFDASIYDNSKDYTALFSNKISEISYVAYMSDWLKNEYLALEK